METWPTAPLPDLGGVSNVNRDDHVKLWDEFVVLPPLREAADDFA
jgi:hypothetical protein